MKTPIAKISATRSTLGVWRAPLLAGVSLTLGLGACASSGPPPMLVEARSSYDDAETGRAGQVAPAELFEARQSLTRAEDAFKEDGDSWVMRTQAYIAIRKAERANVIADERDQQAAIKSRVENKEALSDLLRDDATRRLGDAKDQLGDTKVQLGNTKAQLEDEKARTARAEEARVQAEVDTEAARAKLQAMTDRLKAIALVAENERGLVISLSSGVIFASGSSVLRAPAFPKLDQVADVLKGQPGRRVTIEGHTDSNGPDADNMMLSAARAESVRAYLASRGVDAGHLSAVGLGESRPIADNHTVEGRANNRRVEIVLAPLPKLPQ